MILTPEIIKQEYEKNSDLITIKESVKHPGLFVLKYKRKVFYDNLWNPFLEECRGLVVDKDWNIIQRPFLKIYNYGIEKEAPVLQDDDLVVVQQKINGFMVAVSWHNGNLIVSTTGSLDSGFVDIARNWLNDVVFDWKFYDGYTFLFECCDPSDPHIIGHDPGLYLLGLRNKFTGTVTPITTYSINMENVFSVPLSQWSVAQLKNAVRTVKHEGFVFYSWDERSISSKIKSPYYLTKKFLMRTNINKIMSLQRSQVQDEEFWPLIQYIQEVDSDEFSNLDELSKREYIENWFNKE
jgi:hypothetical protein